MTPFCDGLERAPGTLATRRALRRPCSRRFLNDASSGFTSVFVLLERACKPLLIAGVLEYKPAREEGPVRFPGKPEAPGVKGPRTFLVSGNAGPFDRVEGRFRTALWTRHTPTYENRREGLHQRGPGLAIRPWGAPLLTRAGELPEFLREGASHIDRDRRILGFEHAPGHGLED